MSAAPRETPGTPGREAQRGRTFDHARRGVHLDGDDLVALIPAVDRAEVVELCVLSADGSERRAELSPAGSRSGSGSSGGHDGWWFGRLENVADGDHYGLRVHGAWDPSSGLRANPAKLLVDPWARRIGGALTDLGAALAYQGTAFSARRSIVDSAPYVPHGVVTADAPADHGFAPRVPWSDTVLYETHVRDLTMRHPDVPPELRGTYLGVAHPAVVEHLRRLGVTTVELLPVFANAPEPALVERGRRNHWGYSTLGYLAPEPRYAATPGAEVGEFAAMVRALHDAGLEVVLDVVFNHTCEGGVSGPSLSWRGLDAAGWYVLDSRGHDVDLTGCGNTLDAGSPLVQTLVVDCLRHWVTEFGVDGFRFDLASTLGRPRGGPFDAGAPLLDLIASDPVLSTVKLIAEPWDATGEGYQVGGFPAGWAEWNGRFRDGARDFWRDVGPVSEIVTRLAGSSDLYWPRRPPTASVNFVTAHDGFTLRDLVSYERKHNDANGEDNRDGTDDNRSWNCGAEGPTNDAWIRALRARQVRNMLATLGLAAGTPMLLGGDELAHTQGGNNNVYCLDDETSWRDWSRPALVDFVSRVLALRRATRALRRADFFYGLGTDDPTGAVPDIAWLSPTGVELGSADWPEHRSTLVVRVDGSPAVLFVLHAGGAPVEVALPTAFGDGAWEPVLDAGTADGAPASSSSVRGTVVVPAHTFVAYRAL